MATYAAFEPVLKTFTSEEQRLITGFFAEDDELLGDRYHSVYNDNIGGFCKIPGGHHVTEKAVEIICNKFLMRG